jgi:RNA-directed DNA polymerase
MACFEHETDARAFLAPMTERLADFDLEVEPSKTAVLRFGSRCLGRTADATRGPRTFSFLGFTHYVGRSRRGRFVVGHKAERPWWRF